MDLTTIRVLKSDKPLLDEAVINTDEIIRRRLSQWEIIKIMATVYNSLPDDIRHKMVLEAQSDRQ